MKEAAAEKDSNRSINPDSARKGSVEDAAECRNLKRNITHDSVGEGLEERPRKRHGSCWGISNVPATPLSDAGRVIAKRYGKIQVLPY